MKFVIDAQVFQTATWHRGMGKYSLAIIKALQEYGYFAANPLEFVLNANLTLDEDRRELLKETFPGVQFRELNLQTTNAINLKSTQKHNKEQLDIAYGSQEITFFVPSLFENEVTPVFPTQATKLLLAYDLIPLFFYDRYLTH